MSPASEPIPATKFEWSLACDLSQVSTGALQLHAFLAQAGWSEAMLADCEMALVEAVNNAVQYATSAGRLLPIAIHAESSAAGIEIIISDHTPGFILPESIELPDPEQERGRGLFLIRQLMDEVEYFNDPAGNRLVLRKHTPPRPALT